MTVIVYYANGKVEKLEDVTSIDKRYYDPLTVWVDGAERELADAVKLEVIL